MKKKALVPGAALAAAILMSLPVQAQGRWELIGTRSVGFQVDRDRVSGRGEGRFQAIRLCVGGAPVHFRDVDVRFRNGQRQDLPVHRRIGPGQCTPPLGLRGGERRIDEVIMTYNAVPTFRGRATVSVYGLQDVAGPGPRPGRWEVLGRKTVGFNVERDVFRGLGGEGRFRALRLCVTGNAVQFREVEVEFGNGQSQRLPVRHFARPGQCTPPLNLVGRERRIRRVVMVYNAVPNFRGQAQVVLQALR